MPSARRHARLCNVKPTSIVAIYGRSRTIPRPSMHEVTPAGGMVARSDADLRVLFSHDIFQSQSHGGASRLFVGLHRALRSQGVQSTVCAGIHINTHLEKEQGVVGRMLPPTAGLLQRRVLTRGNRAFERALTATWRPDIYHVTYFPRRRHRPAAPVVVTVLDMIHELFAEQFPDDDPTSERKRWWTRSADLIVAISDTTKQDLVSMFDVPEDKIVVIYPGLAPLYPDPDLDIRAYGDYILYVGRRVPAYKNFTRCVEAWAQTAHGAPLQLVCFGGGPLTEEERSDLVRHNLLARAFVLSGPDAHLASLYAGARACVYPSVYEGFGFPPLEAMSLGCPVACSRAGPIPEIVGHAAVFFDPSDIDDMAQAIAKTVDDERLRSGLRRAGLERASSFTWKRAAECTVAGYRSVTDPTREYHGRGFFS